MPLSPVMRGRFRDFAAAILFALPPTAVMFVWSGPARALAHLQLRVLGSYFPEATYVVVFGAWLLALAGIVRLGQRLFPQLGSFGDLLASSSSAWTLLLRVGPPAATVVGITFFASGLLTGPPQVYSLASFSSAGPPTAREIILTDAVVDLDSRVTLIEGNEKSGRRTDYIPLREAAPDPQQSAIVAVVETDLARHIPLLKQPRFAGTVSRTGLPGIVLDRFAEAGVPLADNHFVLGVGHQVNADAAIGLSLMLAGLIGVVVPMIPNVRLWGRTSSSSE